MPGVYKYRPVMASVATPVASHQASKVDGPFLHLEKSSAKTGSGAKPRAKPLALTPSADDFLSRLETAEARDSHRQSSNRDAADDLLTSPPASRRTAPLAAFQLDLEAAKPSARGLEELPSGRMSSARVRHTPRPSPKPTPTPRAPRAVRTPQAGDNSNRPNAVGFNGFESTDAERPAARA